VSIEVNGKNVDWIKNESIQDLLKRVKYTFPLVIIKIDGKIIPRSDFLIVKVPNNSKIAVIHMISGG
jgi:thiazole synthase/sulfur carrier protein